MRQELRRGSHFCVAACPCAGPRCAGAVSCRGTVDKGHDPAACGMTARRLIDVIAGCAALLLAAVLLYFCHSLRDNTNAPKERLHPVTLAFTDVESGTVLWAACPETMPDAVATHHRLVRSLIAGYHRYEWKTTGDSFMIACKRVLAAVQLVREQQQVFLQQDWGTSVIDDAYHMFEEDRAEEDAEYEPPTACLNAAVYRQYWGGLRVRVGVHTGVCDIRCGEVTKGFDCYGEASNTAARTESVGNGGQLLLTRASYFSLSLAEREQVEVTALGAVAPRGVPKPVEMYQLDAVPGRTFAALRLDREVPDLDGGTASDVASSYSEDASLCDSALCVASVIRILLAAYPVSERHQVLSRMCNRWNVSDDRIRWDVSADKKAARAVERLSLRLNQVLERSLSAHGTRSGLSQGTSDRHTLGRGESVSCGTMSPTAAVELPTFSGGHRDERAAS
ncbi:receptor-type adenylate cyclase, partial [Trypanosoma cruzi]